MITHHHGDLVKAFIKGDVDVLLHQANCQNTFGSGIARQIREELPEAYEADTLHYNAFVAEVGDYSMATHVVNDMSTGRMIFNLYGQDFYNRKPGEPDTIYWGLFKAMSTVKRGIGIDKKIGIPYEIGCGLGGGHWPLVYQYIQQEFRNHDVHIYKFNPNMTGNHNED